MWLLVPFRLIQRTACRFQDEHFVQTAAALSFATLVGLVPMIAAAFALISLLPVGVGLGSALQKFLLANLLPDKAGVIIAKYIGQFAARTGHVTLFGVGVLGATALMQMLTIERAFNHIWRVKANRPFLRRWQCMVSYCCLGHWCSAPALRRSRLSPAFRSELSTSPSG
jgi:membrane protein